MSIQAKEFEFSDSEVSRLKAALQTWDGYGVAPDRPWLEPMIAGLFQIGTRGGEGCKRQRWRQLLGIELSGEKELAPQEEPSYVTDLENRKSRLFCSLPTAQNLLQHSARTLCSRSFSRHWTSLPVAGPEVGRFWTAVQPPDLLSDILRSGAEGRNSEVARCNGTISEVEDDDRESSIQEDAHRIEAGIHTRCRSPLARGSSHQMIPSERR